MTAPGKVALSFAEVWFPRRSSGSDAPRRNVERGSSQRRISPDSIVRYAKGLPDINSK
jgi:hypothetical protein